MLSEFLDFVHLKLRAIPFEILRGADWKQKIKMWGGGVHEKKCGGGGVRGKNKMYGGFSRNNVGGRPGFSPVRPPEDFKWNSPKYVHGKIFNVCMYCTCLIPSPSRVSCYVDYRTPTAQSPMVLVIDTLCYVTIVFCSHFNPCCSSHLEDSIFTENVIE